MPRARAYALAPLPSSSATVRNAITKGSGIEPRKLLSGFSAHNRVWINRSSLGLIEASEAERASLAERGAVRSDLVAGAGAGPVVETDIDVHPPSKTG